MPNTDDHRAETSANASGISASRDQLTRRERSLWVSALLLLSLLAFALAAVSWDTIKANPHRLEALPVGLVVLVILFGAYAWSKTSEIAELRGLVRGIEQRTGIPVDDAQLNQLFSLIQRSQQGYRELIDTFEDSLFSISLDGEVLTVNRSFADLLGRSFPDIVGRPLTEFVEFPDSGSELNLAQMLPRFLERRHWSGTLRVRLKNNPGLRYFDCVLHAIARGGEVRGISGLARDITQQRENEARFTELFETLQEGVYVASPDDRIVEANPSLARMLGYPSKEDLMGVELGSLYAGAGERDADRAALRETGVIRGREIALRRKSGGEIAALHTETALRDAAGRVLRFQGSVVDVTEHRDIERQLHREQEFARRLMDSFPDIVVALDTEGRYTFTSPRMMEVLGFRPEELIGKKLGERTDPEDRRALEALYDDLLSGHREEGIVEYRTQHRNGEWRLMRATARPLYDEKGQAMGLIASARDITEQHRMQQQLIQSERLAAMGQMIAGVAHELNNPLTAILGVSEMLREQSSDETVKRHLDLAHRQARRAADIVQSLLAFSRPPAPRNSLLHLSDLLQRTLQLHDRSLRENRIKVDFVVRPELPTVFGDPNQLTQVFLNLISNAEQAIREVRDSGTLRIRLGVSGDRVLITFQDDGVGIPRDVLPRIFDPFFTTKRPGRGTGLGLSISMAIVREHNGTISALPVPDGGSVFTISLPVCLHAPALTQPPAGTPASGAQAARTPVPNSAIGGKRILVVDDEESILDLVADGLGARDLVVDCAATCDQALELAATHSYDAILCDLNLAGGAGKSTSGREVRKRICEIWAERSSVPAPFIFMTGDLVPPGAAQELGQDGSRFLQKPFRISDLFALLLEMMGPAAAVPPRKNSSS